ncbi:ubiquitin-related modifier 1 [Sphaerosporella brunnea]|uniref:Ubiquitin-related modifier 1 n=1 Tax=Sphaerosporella brunnea TaxID=1250544 RepID=A0A5J5F8E2_9PEZI|nr:ubiquitin-related modifier 1 [Sphaerosporella brunnea]
MPAEAMAPPAAETKTIPITVEFSGGLELLFKNQRTYKLSVPDVDPSTNAATTVGYLVKHLAADVMVDARKELFVVEGSVRPGILVLINDADWELEGEEEYVLQPGDAVLFVSTLHGG